MAARGVSDGPTQNYWEVRIPEPGFQWIFQVRTYRVGSVLYNRPIGSISLSQWLNFKLFGITYLVGKIKFKLFFQGPLAE